MLYFAPQNAKTKKLTKKRFAQKWLKGRKLYSLDLVSGHSCPFAKECKSMAIETPEGWRIKDGPYCKFRCFSASQEAQYPNVRIPRQKNFDKLKKAKTTKTILSLLKKSLPKDAGIIRLHVGGDFFSQAYFDAILALAKSRPDILFYGYTKAIKYWAKRKNQIPANFNLTASYGGTLDHLIKSEGFRSCLVVHSKYQARKLNLPVDSDDSHAANSSGSFTIVVHGTQPIGSEYGKIVYRDRRK